MAIHRQLDGAFLDSLCRCKNDRNPSLVVQMPGTDEPVVKHLGTGINGDRIAYIDAKGAGIVVALDTLVQPQLQITPGGGLRVDFRAKGVSRGLQGQNAATKPFAAIAEDGTAGAFGKPGRPVADWHHLQPAGVAYALDHGAERIEVGDDRPIGAASFA